ncbi:YihY/virulence factor BrkB family protein [Kitasatospora sp. NPDC093679]|uniref:YihY/virulence factor BrkB family protein n=1 Tax=Kitasatospora sp. NPDC093679 TaxID=3154983 RepID=UPI0034223433
MADEHSRHDRRAEGPARGGLEGPSSPLDVPARGWWQVLKRTAREFMADELPDRAAALTYYGILAIFPALLVLVSVLALAGTSATDTVLDNLRSLAPGPARDILHSAITQLQNGRAAGGFLAVIGLAGALWSASGYIGAFIRAANAVYDIREGRPMWKTTPLRIGLTLLTMVLLVLCAVIVVFTGRVARRAGDLLGLGDTALTVWAVAKWPALVLLVALMIALLYWAAPNVRGRGLRWTSPGSLLAVLLWLALSAGFAAYVANFGSYNKTYGTLAGVVVFLVWLWLTNLAVLLGLELDAELAREQAIRTGQPRTLEPYVAPRDTRTWHDEDDDLDPPGR